MATERLQNADDHVPHPDESYSSESDELPPITREDVVRVIEKIEAGRATNSYRFSPNSAEPKPNLCAFCDQCHS